MQKTAFATDRTITFDRINFPGRIDLKPNPPAVASAAMSD
jgi:hypothetical protein